MCAVSCVSIRDGFCWFCCRSACVSPDCGSDAGSVVLWGSAGRFCDGQDLLSGQRRHGRLSDL